MLPRIIPATRLVLAACAVLALALACATGARARVLTYGVSGVTPSLDTANGDYQNAKTKGINASASCPYGILCGPELNPLSKTNPILPAPFTHENKRRAPHSAEDLAVWNPRMRASVGGQVSAVRVTGCAIEDTRSPTQLSQGIPVTTTLFQTLKPRGHSWAIDEVAGTAPAGGAWPLQMPFCKSAGNPDGVAPSHVTTLHPLHMCIDRGEALAFHDLGGFVDANGPYYPQGIPMEVLAPVSGQSTDSFIGVGTSVYGPGVYGSADPTAGARQLAGYANERDQEVTMQIVEGTGEDALASCPGGFAYEPAGSDRIVCDQRYSSYGKFPKNPAKKPDHPFCKS